MILGHLMTDRAPAHASWRRMPVSGGRARFSPPIGAVRTRTSRTAVPGGPRRRLATGTGADAVRTACAQVPTAMQLMGRCPLSQTSDRARVSFFIHQPLAPELPVDGVTAADEPREMGPSAASVVAVETAVSGVAASVSLCVPGVDGAVDRGTVSCQAGQNQPPPCRYRRLQVGRVRSKPPIARCRGVSTGPGRIRRTLGGIGLPAVGSGAGPVGPSADRTCRSARRHGQDGPRRAFLAR